MKNKIIALLLLFYLFASKTAKPCVMLRDNIRMLNDIIESEKSDKMKHILLLEIMNYEALLEECEKQENVSSQKQRKFLKERSKSF